MLGCRIFIKMTSLLYGSTCNQKKKKCTVLETLPAIKETIRRQHLMRLPSTRQQENSYHPALTIKPRSALIILKSLGDTKASPHWTIKIAFIKKLKNRARAQRNPKYTGIKQSRKETPQKITGSHKKKDYKHTETRGNTKSYRGNRQTNHRSARLVPRAWPSRHSALSPSPIPWCFPSLALL